MARITTLPRHGNPPPVGAKAKTLGEVQYSNSLHGFQVSGNTVIVAWHSDHINKPAVEKYVWAETGVSTFKFDDWMGRDYFEVGYGDRAKIPSVINAFLDAIATHEEQTPVPVDFADSTYKFTFTNLANAATSGHNGMGDIIHVTPEGHVFLKNNNSCVPNHFIVTTGCTLHTRLKPWYKPGQRFSIGQSEKNFIDSWNLYDTGELKYNQSVLPWPCFRPERWKSTKGKEFCQKIRKEAPYRASDEWVAAANEYESGTFSHLVVGEGAAQQIEAIDWPLVAHPTVPGRPSANPRKI